MAYGNPNSTQTNQEVNNSDKDNVQGYGGSSEGLAQLQEGEPTPSTRFRDANSANSWAVDRFQADTWGAYDRSLVAEMNDGAPPMSQGDLRLNGEGNNFNINFGRGFAKEEQALSSFQDLANSDENIITCECDWQKATVQEREEYAAIYSRGFTRLHRFFWPDFVPNLQLLSKNFIRYGVGIAFRGNSWDWRWSVSGLGDFQISRRDGCAVDDLEAAVQRKFETPPDVMQWISNPIAAKAVGWDVQATLKAVQNATITVGQDANGQNWEQIQKDAKDNGLWMTKGKDPRVELRHFWVKEFPDKDDLCKISHYITSPSNNENFLYKDIGKWNSASDCMTFFTYGIGNGDFYSIRGLGYKIFALEQMFNVLMSRLGDSTLRSTSYLWQPNSPDSLEDANQIIWGADAIIPVGLKPVEAPTSNVGQNVLQMLNMLGNIESINTGTYTASQQMLPGGQPDRKSATQAQIEASQEAILTSSAKVLFMQSLDRTYAMSSRALTRRDYPRDMPGGPERWRLLRYCMDHGMPEEAFYHMECVRAVRPIGMGSPAMQAQKLEATMSILPFLDETAQRFLVRKKVISNLGPDYGFLVPDKPKMSPDKKVAELESSLFTQGITPELGNDEDDVAHLEEHLNYIAHTLQGAEQQGLEPEQALKQLSASIPHAQAHAARLEKNPTKKGESTKFNQALQQADAAAKKLGQNFGQSQQAETDAQKEEQEKMTAFQMEQQRLDAESQARIAREDAVAQADLALKTKQTDAQIALAQDKATADTEIKQAVTTHKVIDGKAKTAADIESNQALTATDISNKNKVTRQKVIAKDIETASNLETKSKKTKKTDSTT